MQDLFPRPSNLFSFKHVYFAEIESKKAGMVLSYNWETKRKENLKTGFLFIKKLGIKTLKVILDVEKENANAFNFYKKLGYLVINEFSIYLGKQRIEFYRMAKNLHSED